MWLGNDTSAGDALNASDCVDAQSAPAEGLQSMATDGNKTLACHYVLLLLLCQSMPGCCKACKQTLRLYVHAEDICTWRSSAPWLAFICSFSASTAPSF